MEYGGSMGHKSYRLLGSQKKYSEATSVVLVRIVEIKPISP